jgi:hypothetical protein
MSDALSRAYPNLTNSRQLVQLCDWFGGEAVVRSQLIVRVAAVGAFRDAQVLEIISGGKSGRDPAVNP